MDAKTAEFIEEAKNKVPPAYSQYTEKAALWVATSLGPDRANLRHVSALAAAWAAENAENAPSYTSPPVLPIPLDFVQSEMRADWARPWAQEVRRELFGVPEPPFDNMASAISWIENEAGTIDRTPDEGRVTRMHDYLLRVYEEFREFLDGEGLPFDVDIELKGHTLSYPGKDGWQIALPATFHRELRRLSVESDKMAKACGWQQQQTVLFILTDIPPFVSRVSLTVHPRSTNGEHGQGPLTLRSAELRIAGVDFSEKDLESVFKSLRQSGVTQKKPLRKLDARIFLFIRQHRSPWNKNNPLNWKETLQEWNAENPQHRYKSIRGLQKVLKRCYEKSTSLPGA